MDIDICDNYENDECNALSKVLFFSQKCAAADQENRTKKMKILRLSAAVNWLLLLLLPGKVITKCIQLQVA